MVSNLVVYQLALIALVWLFLMLSYCCVFLTLLAPSTRPSLTSSTEVSRAADHKNVPRR